MTAPDTPDWAVASAGQFQRAAVGSWALAVNAFTTDIPLGGWQTLEVACKISTIGDIGVWAAIVAQYSDEAATIERADWISVYYNNGIGTNEPVVVQIPVFGEHAQIGATGPAGLSTEMLVSVSVTNRPIDRARTMSVSSQPTFAATGAIAQFGQLALSNEYPYDAVGGVAYSADSLVDICIDTSNGNAGKVAPQLAYVPDSIGSASFVSADSFWNCPSLSVANPTQNRQIISGVAVPLGNCRPYVLNTSSGAIGSDTYRMRFMPHRTS